MIIIGNESIENLDLEGLSGIDIRSRRGAIGASFWGRRWMDFFDANCDAVELENGRRMARKSQVYQVTLQAGRVAGIAAEIRQDPFLPFMDLPLLDDKQQEALVSWVQTDPEATAYLFAGILPEAFLEVVNCQQTVPEAGQGGCSCDWNEGLCRHQVAMHCAVAEYLDREPWAFVELLGASHLELCNRVRKRWGAPPVEKNQQMDHCKESNLCDFYGDASKIPQDTALMTLTELDALERLGVPPFFPPGERNLKRTLEKLYEE